MWLAAALAASGGGAWAADGDLPAGTTTKAGADGFNIQSEDGSFKLKLTGFAQTDARLYLSDDDNAGTNSFLLRRARPIVQGTVYKYFDFNLTPDFGGGSAVIQDAFLDARFNPAFRVKIGKFKGPVGLELLNSDITLPVNERGLTQDLVPNRDIGLLIHGELGGGVAYYQAGIFDGAADGASLDGDTNDAKDFEGRLFLTPFKKSASSPLNGLGVGFAGTAGNQSGAVPSFKTIGQLTLASYATAVTADGSRTRLAPQASFDSGPVRLLGEWVSSEQKLRKSATDTLSARNTAWQASGSVVLTGETPVQGLVTPKRPFDPAKGTWGALEIAARYSALDVDDDVFTLGYADPAKSARSAHEYGIALDWYLNHNVKYLVSYDHTTFKGGAASGGDRKDEGALLVRAQIIF